MLNRLSGSIGHLESIKRMVEEGRDSAGILTRPAAVRAAVNRTGRVIPKNHVSRCVADALENGDSEALENLAAVISRFLK